MTSNALDLVEAAWREIERGDMDKLAELFTPDAELTTAAGGGAGREYVTEVFARHVEGYPDLRHRIIEAIESSDRQSVAVRLEFDATHLGELRGPVGFIPPSGKHLTWRSADQVHVVGGRIRAWHAQFDRLAILLQLGLRDQVAPPEQRAAKEVLRGVLTECFEKGDVDALDRFLTPDFVNHRRPPGVGTGIKGLKEIVGMERAAFPDITFTIDHEVAEGDLVIQVATAEATHRGSIFGVAPTGRRVRWQQIHIVKMRDAKMAEHWGMSDIAGLLRQMQKDPKHDDNGADGRARTEATR